jgi:hypothetical protein
MAYQAQQLSALSYANGFTLWHYRTVDPAAEIDTAGYFDQAVRMLRVGDFILANTASDSTPASGIFVVTANNGRMVDVANLSPLGVLNTD